MSKKLTALLVAAGLGLGSLCFAQETDSVRSVVLSEVIDGETLTLELNYSKKEGRNAYLTVQKCQKDCCITYRDFYADLELDYFVKTTDGKKENDFEPSKIAQEDYWKYLGLFFEKYNSEHKYINNSNWDII